MKTGQLPHGEQALGQAQSVQLIGLLEWCRVLEQENEGGPVFGDLSRETSRSGNVHPVGEIAIETDFVPVHPALRCRFASARVLGRHLEKQ